MVGGGVEVCEGPGGTGCPVVFGVFDLVHVVHACEVSPPFVPLLIPVPTYLLVYLVLNYSYIIYLDKVHRCFRACVVMEVRVNGKVMLIQY